MLEETLIKAIESSNMKDLAVDIAEVGLDAFTADGPLRDFPLIGSILNSVHGALSIRDALFSQKLLRFLHALDRVSVEKRTEQIGRIASNPKERRRVGATLMLLLVRLNDQDKPDLLAKCFELYLDGTIDRGTFDAFANVVDRLTITDMYAFAEQYRGHEFGMGAHLDYFRSQFFQCGLLQIHFNQIEYTPNPNRVSPNKVPAAHIYTSDIGDKFYKLVMMNLLPPKAKKDSNASKGK